MNDIAPKKKSTQPKKNKTQNTKSKNTKNQKTKNQYSKAEVEQIFSIFQQNNPEPKGELNYVNTFTLLVAVVLSAQATDVGVNKATKTLFERADSPQKILDLGSEGLIDHIKSIGLYRSKAKNILALSKILIEEHDSKVPDTRKELEKLPGVGRKTANVVLNIAFGQPTMAIDTHIFRISNRTGLAPGKTTLEVENNLMEIIPEPYRLHAHHWLILHGRYICKARKPECGTCPIYDLCKYEEKQA